MSAHIDKNIEAKTNSMFGVDLTNPRDVAKFLLTQITLRSGTDCLQGYSTVPNEADPSLIEEVVYILNEALLSCKGISENIINNIASACDYTIKIVDNELKSSQFFLNGNNLVYESRSKEFVPVKAMLSWIQDNQNNKPSSAQTNILKFLEKSIENIKAESQQSACISR